MEQLEILLQRIKEYIEYFFNSYEFRFPVTSFSATGYLVSYDTLFLVLFLLLPLIGLGTLWLHPVYFLSRHNSLQKLSWRKINYAFAFSKTAKVIAENDHYGFKPKMEIIIYKSQRDLFNSIELFCLGTTSFVLCIPEKMWIKNNDGFIASLLAPSVTLKKRYLLLNTVIFMFTKSIKSAQISTFMWINSKIKNQDVKNFLMISLYVFFLPLLYTRLNLRYYIYFKQMQKIYGAELAHVLSAEFHNELETFLNKPISYFFGQIHEKA